MLKLNRYDARRLLAHQHFTEADLKTVFKRLGSVQFDPLNPVGRNHDLVLQARGKQAFQKDISHPSNREEKRA